VFELILDDLRLVVTRSSLSAKCRCFSSGESTYRVTSRVSREALFALAAAIEDVPNTIASETAGDLAHLSGEFSFTELRREVSAWSLAWELESECQPFCLALTRLNDISPLLIDLSRSASAGQSVATC
jgi:hypothetical protein